MCDRMSRKINANRSKVLVVRKDQRVNTETVQVSGVGWEEV